MSGFPAFDPRGLDALAMLAGVSQLSRRTPAPGGRARIPFILVTGFLGSGKTTLLRRLLAAEAGPIAVIVNDFGPLGIDAALIRDRTADTIELANGCVCCSQSVGLANLLADLMARPSPPSAVVLEASGVAEPLSILHVALAHPELRFGGVVALADAEAAPRQLADPRLTALLTAQLAASDIVLLNKIDLVDADGRAAALAAVAAVAPGSRLLETTRADAPLEALFGLESAPVRRAQPVGGQAHAAFARHLLTSARPLEADRLVALFSALPASVLRSKGFVALADRPDRKHLLQTVGGRWSLDDEGPWNGEPALSQVVLIGWPDPSELTAIEEEWRRCG